MSSIPPTRDSLPVVVDTNVALDWLLFSEPSVGPLFDAIGRGALRWVATQAMRDELSHVLGRGLALQRGTPMYSALQRWDGASRLVESSMLGSAQRLCCSDPQDQMFIDLALSARARWLVTRDKALLKLAGRARPLGVEVVTPQAWSFETA